MLWLKERDVDNPLGVSTEIELQLRDIIHKRGIYCVVKMVSQVK